MLVVVVDHGRKFGSPAYHSLTNSVDVIIVLFTGFFKNFFYIVSIED